MPKILFYIERNLHLPHLLPIYAELSKIPGMETAFSAPPFVPTAAHSPGWGLQQETIKRLEQIAPFYSSPKDFSPDVTVIADACQFRLPPGCGSTVNVGHGLICKGTFFTPSTVSRRENLSTVLCVPGPWHKKRLESQVKIPIEVTGFIKTDALVNGSFPDKKTFFAKQGLPANAHHVLFAPTFNPELSSLPFVIPVLEKIASPDTSVSIKLHAMTPPEWVDECYRLARDHEHIAMLDEDDYSPMMHHCDLMVSDVSSIFVEFMLQDKPVVLFSRPDLSHFAKFDTTDIEYQVRKGCSEVTRPSTLCATIRRELAYPKNKSRVRQSFRKALDYGRDGKSAQRAAQVVLETLDSSISPKKKPREKFLLVVDGKDASRDLMEKTLQNARMAAGELSMETYVCREADTKIPTSSNSLTMEGLDRLLKEDGWDHVVFVQAGWRLPYNWAKHMALHLKWEPESRLVRGLAQKQIADRILNDLRFQETEKMPPALTTHYLRTLAIGGTGIGICGKTPCVLASLPWIHSTLEGRKPKSIEELTRLLQERAGDRETGILTALDVFFYPDEVRNSRPRY